MRIGSGKHAYEWLESWAKTPDTDSARNGWSHHGVAVSETGNVISGHQDEPVVQVFDRDGNLLYSWESGCAETHGITLVKEGDTEYLWIADTEAKRSQSTGFEYPSTNGKVVGKAVKKTLDGQTVLQLQPPALPVYEEGDYKPTWVAVNEERNGGNGDVWVADGYGASYVHRYNKAGDYISSINGQEGQAGPFDCPHAIFIDTRKSEPELYVADRSNGRVQVYDLEGNFRRVFGSDFLTSPSGFVTDGNLMVIAELEARLTIVDADDKLVTYLGANEKVAKVKGWPNNKDEKGAPIRPRLLEPGKFNSPHGMAVDGDGNLYIAEWLIGGRFTKLAKV